MPTTSCSAAGRRICSGDAMTEQEVKDKGRLRHAGVAAAALAMRKPR
jgi:hypothetical protein